MTSSTVILCGPEARLTTRSKFWSTSKRLPVCFAESGKTATLKIEDISSKMIACLPPIITDLVEIAAYVYCADQGIGRGGVAGFDYGSRWHRQLRFEIPVQCSDIWNKPVVKQALQATLGFLSDDYYDFSFTQSTRKHGLSDYLQMGQTASTAPKIDSVMLFSGGLDSLAGAVEEVLVAPRRVALVSHRSVAKIDGRQQALVSELIKRAKSGFKPLHVPVWVHLHGVGAMEFTQRSRSFLFAALAAAVTKMCGLKSFQFYENGVTSLNIPLCEQLSGARATRTTHPKVMDGFGRLFSSLTEKALTITTPFTWHTKTEVVRTLQKAGHADLIQNSVSCTRTRTTTHEVSHCGKCSQCIDRRFAVLAAGCDQHDPEDTYQTPLFTGERKSVEDQTMVERWVGTSDRIYDMKRPEQFLLEYPQANDATSFMGGSANDNAIKLFDLHKRHAADVVKVTDAATGQYGHLMRGTMLPATCLLRLVAAPRLDPENLRHDQLIPDPVANVALAKLAELKEPDQMSRCIRAAITDAGAAVKIIKPGEKRYWTHIELKTAYPKLPNGKLKIVIEQSGLANLTKPAQT